ncbi:MAG TPA: hypothetical protein DF613_07230 [Lachnospiraceae bacterium]|nr:hypothetical protein [Lachnospiraceae bacterium]
MFKRLHIRLTFSGTLVSGLILILMSLVCITFSEARARENNFSHFRLKTAMLVHQTESRLVLSLEWFSQLKADTRFEIDIRDNGEKLLLGDLSPCGLDTEIITMARETARKEYGLAEESFSPDTELSSYADFELHTDRQDYYACIALIPRSGRILNVAVLYPLTEFYHSLRLNRLLFAGADILGIILLGIFFWFYTRRMIRPLTINRRKQTEFIAAASHELRSPLTLMLSCLSSMDGASEEERERFSSIMKEEGKRMGRLIDDMLTLSNSDTSRLSIYKTYVEMDTLVLSAFEKFEPLALKKKIFLDFTLPDSLSTPYACDKERIEQVLSILLDNALSYTPENGRVCLSLTESSGRLTIRVADNGIGIPDAEKEAVFERFYRCDKAHRDKKHFGLGLSIAQEIIRMHKGEIRVEDTPGGGATFVVTFSGLKIKASHPK